METLLMLLVIREVNPPVTTVPHRKGTVTLSVNRAKAVDQTVELHMIWYTVNFVIY